MEITRTSRGRTAPISERGFFTPKNSTPVAACDLQLREGRRGPALPKIKMNKSPLTGSNVCQGAAPMSQSAPAIQRGSHASKMSVVQVENDVPASFGGRTRLPELRSYVAEDGLCDNRGAKLDVVAGFPPKKGFLATLTHYFPIPLRHTRPLGNALYVIGSSPSPRGNTNTHLKSNLTAIPRHSRHCSHSHTFSLFLPGSVIDVSIGGFGHETRGESEAMEDPRRASLEAGRPLRSDCSGSTLRQQARRPVISDIPVYRPLGQDSGADVRMAGKGVRFGR